MADERPTLENEIRRLISVAGPMPVSDYIRLCLTHPQYGYYLTREPIGAGGDFITSPEISQIFGELIGLWLATVWHLMGMPENVRVIELGPGRGSMMADAMRAANIVKDFHAAVVLHFVEVSPHLKAEQERRLEDSGVPAYWHPDLADVPPGPSIIVANEFIDALPVHQAVKHPDGWHERVVIIAPDGDLAIGVAADPLPHFDSTLPPVLRRSPEGSIFEWRDDTIALEIGRQVRAGGAALIIDYGHAWHGLGETLQAVSGHQFTDPLREPGSADLTAHVDFMALAQAAQTIGGRIHGPVSQREFLRRLGIEQRAATLKARASRETGAEIDAAVARLMATGPTGMGELFKVMAVSDPKLGPLPGLEP